MTEDRTEAAEKPTPDFSLPRGVLAAILASWAILVAAIEIAPSEWAFRIGIAYVTFSGVATLYAAYRARDDEEVREKLSQFTETAWWDARSTAADRMLPAVILLIMLMIQLIVASETLPREKAEALASLITVGPVELGAFQIVTYLIFAWLLGPIGMYFLRRGYRSVKEAM